MKQLMLAQQKGPKSEFPVGAVMMETMMADFIESAQQLNELHARYAPRVTRGCSICKTVPSRKRTLQVGIGGGVIRDQVRMCDACFQRSFVFLNKNFAFIMAMLFAGERTIQDVKEHDQRRALAEVKGRVPYHG